MMTMTIMVAKILLQLMLLPYFAKEYVHITGYSFEKDIAKSILDVLQNSYKIQNCFRKPICETIKQSARLTDYSLTNLN